MFFFAQSFSKLILIKKGSKMIFFDILLRSYWKKHKNVLNYLISFYTIVYGTSQSFYFL